MAGGEWPGRCDFVRDGRAVPHAFSVLYRLPCPAASWWNSQLLLYSKCTHYTTIRREPRHARKAWPATLVDPCLLSGHHLSPWYGILAGIHPDFWYRSRHFPCYFETVPNKYHTIITPSNKPITFQYTTNMYIPRFCNMSCVLLQQIFVLENWRCESSIRKVINPHIVIKGVGDPPCCLWQLPLSSLIHKICLSQQIVQGSRDSAYRL